MKRNGGGGKIKKSGFELQKGEEEEDRVGEQKTPILH